MKNSVEVAKILGISPRSVTNRANRLEIKKRSNAWLFTEMDIDKMKLYQPIKQFQSKFYFSKDGRYLVINSRMNKYEGIRKKDIKTP